jgi:hypothetical protein
MLTCFPTSPVLAMALATAPATVIQHDVRFVVGMPVRTELLSDIGTGEGLTTQCIRALRNSFKMLWPNTSACPAKMIDGLAQRNRPPSKFIGEPVSHPSTALIFGMPVAVRHDIAGPQPTLTGFIDTCPKGSRSVTFVRHREVSFLGVAEQDVSASLLLYFTPSPEAKARIWRRIVTRL